MRFFFVAVIAAASGCAALDSAQPPMLGVKPAYLTELATQVPNEAAIGTRIFVPGLDEGFVPQGLAVVGDHILVSSYKPTPDLTATTGHVASFASRRRRASRRGSSTCPWMRAIAMRAASPSWAMAM